MSKLISARCELKLCHINRSGPVFSIIKYDDDEVILRTRMAIGDATWEGVGGV